jgi:hypothetical protein
LNVGTLNGVATDRPNRYRLTPPALKSPRKAKRRITLFSDIIATISLSPNRTADYSGLA